MTRKCLTHTLQTNPRQTQTTNSHMTWHQKATLSLDVINAKLELTLMNAQVIKVPNLRQ